MSSVNSIYSPSRFSRYILLVFKNSPPATSVNELILLSPELPGAPLGFSNKSVLTKSFIVLPRATFSYNDVAFELLTR